MAKRNAVGRVTASFDATCGPPRKSFRELVWVPYWQTLPHPGEEEKLYIWTVRNRSESDPGLFYWDGCKYIEFYDKSFTYIKNKLQNHEERITALEAFREIFVFPESGDLPEEGEEEKAYFILSDETSQGAMTYYIWLDDVGYIKGNSGGIYESMTVEEGLEGDELGVRVLQPDRMREIISNIPPITPSETYTLTARDKGRSIDTLEDTVVPKDLFRIGDTVRVTSLSKCEIRIVPAAGVEIRHAGTELTGTLRLNSFAVVDLRMVEENVWTAAGTLLMPDELDPCASPCDMGLRTTITSTLYPITFTDSLLPAMEPVDVLVRPALTRYGPENVAPTLYPVQVDIVTVARYLKYSYGPEAVAPTLKPVDVEIETKVRYLTTTAVPEAVAPVLKPVDVEIYTNPKHVMEPEAVAPTLKPVDVEIKTQ